jgi:hypothetical protein
VTDPPPTLGLFLSPPGRRGKGNGLRSRRSLRSSSLAAIRPPRHERGLLSSARARRRSRVSSEEACSPMRPVNKALVPRLPGLLQRFSHQHRVALNRKRSPGLYFAITPLSPRGRGDVKNHCAESADDCGRRTLWSLMTYFMIFTENFFDF